MGARLIRQARNDDMPTSPDAIRRAPELLIAAVVLAGLCLVGRANYLLFHALAELFSIVVACGVFTIAWNTRRLVDSGWILTLGAAYLFVGAIDLLHTLAYKGMGVFPGWPGSNLATQLWVAARYVESGSLLAAFVLARRRVRAWPLVGAYAAVAGLLLLSIFHWRIFPTCFDEAAGLTVFKEASEVAVIAVLAASLAALVRSSGQFDSRVARWLGASVGLTIVSEVTFMLYGRNPYGFFNELGHYLKLISFYLIYKALIETGLRRPVDLLFRNLRNANEELETRVRERTAELSHTVDALRDEVTRREAVESTLRERSRLLEAFFKHAAAPLVFLDAQFNFLRVNEAYAAACGRDVADFPGRNHFDLYPHAENQAIFAEVVRTRRPFQTRARPFVFPDHPEWGVTYWDWKLVPLLDDAGRVECLVFVLEDVTQRTLSRKRLAESEQRYRELVELSPVGIVVSVAGEIAFANPAAAAILGAAEAGELVGKGVLDLVHPDDVALAESRLRQVHEAGAQQGRAEIRLLRPDGTAAVVEFSAAAVTFGRQAAVQAVFRDVTQRKRQEEAIRRERRRLFAVLNMLPGYVSLTGADYRVRFANHKFLETFGEPGDRPCHVVQMGRDAPCPDCPLPGILDTRRPAEWEWSSPDGRVYRAWGYPFSDMDGASAVLVLGLDVTERKELERQVTEAGEAERRSIGRDLHDSLGQRLTGLGLLVEALAKPSTDGSPDRAALTRQMLDLVRDSVAQVRAMSKGLDPVGLGGGGLAPALAELAEDVAKQGGPACTARCADGVAVVDDFAATHLYRIAQEAVNNAVRHAEAAAIDIALTADDGGIRLTVTDDGKGIEVRAGAAEGMGLRTMRYRASVLGGTLDITAGPGRGTKVTCFVPAAAGARRREGKA